MTGRRLLSVSFLPQRIMNTVDLVRLVKHRSDVHQLWALVLLLSIKDGATRVWYDPAQDDNQLGYEVGGVEYAMVPPPLSLRPLIPKALAGLLRERSVWHLFVSLMRSAFRRLAPVEGRCMLKIEQHAVTMSATVEPAWSRVVLRLSPDAAAAEAAGVALESYLKSHPRARDGDAGPPQTVGYLLGIGPFDALALVTKAREGVLTRTTLVWKPGMTAWVAAETLPELEPLFASQPPPVPK
jgi:hypothetical protein